jgi:hypothetical protein
MTTTKTVKEKRRFSFINSVSFLPIFYEAQNTRIFPENKIPGLQIHRIVNKNQGKNPLSPHQSACRGNFVNLQQDNIP